MDYRQRATFCNNDTAKKLFNLMADKQTNLCLSADVTTQSELIKLADTVGSEICLLKTHIDIIEDFNPSLIAQLLDVAKRHQFLIFEDRKFADIGHTVKQQYEGGIYHIADWADIINAHTIAGPGTIDGLKQAGFSKGRGLLLLAEMSSQGNLATGEYSRRTLEIAKQHPDFVIGFITQHKLLEDPRYINMTPGIKLERGKDHLGQQYQTPDIAIKENGSDIIIVGRGILGASDPLQEAKKYRAAGWHAYERLLAL